MLGAQCSRAARRGKQHALHCPAPSLIAMPLARAKAPRGCGPWPVCWRHARLQSRHLPSTGSAAPGSSRGLQQACVFLVAASQHCTQGWHELDVGLGTTLAILTDDQSGLCWCCALGPRRMRHHLHTHSRGGRPAPRCRRWNEAMCRGSIIVSMLHVPRYSRTTAAPSTHHCLPEGRDQASHLCR